jgi:hypothetical protein
LSRALVLYVEDVGAIGASHRWTSLIIDTGRLSCDFQYTRFSGPNHLQMGEPCSARYYNLHRANSHHSIHIIKTYRRTRNSFCFVLICSAQLFWNDTSTKVSEPTCSFALRSKSSTSSYFNSHESPYPKVW